MGAVKNECTFPGGRIEARVVQVRRMTKGGAERSGHRERPINAPGTRRISAYGLGNFDRNASGVAQKREGH